MIEAVTDTGLQVGLKTFKFPGGEIQARIEFKPVAQRYINLTCWARSSDDVMELLLVTDALRREYGGIKLNLTMPYFPYARQDRVCYTGEALSVRVMANLINSLGFTTVEIWDAHSPVAPALLNRSVNVEPWHFVKKIPWLTHGNWSLVSPDNGARKRTEECAKRLGGLRVLYADKTRDPKTGELGHPGFENMDLEDRKCNHLIVDDICDGGRTFVKLGKFMKDLLPVQHKIILYVTHGIFSNGFDDLKTAVDEIWTPNPWPDTVDGNFVNRITKGIA